MEQGNKGENRSCPLGNKGGPCNAGYAHPQNYDKKDIQQDICHGGTDQEIQRRTTVPQRGKDTCADIIEEQEQKAEYVDFQIQGGICKNIFGGLDEGEQPIPQKEPQNSHHDADTDAGEKDGADGCFQLAILPAAEQAGNHHGTADIAAHSHRHENHGDGIGGANGSQSILPDELPGNDAVGNVIHLLEHNTQKHGYGKGPQHFSAAALGQVGNQSSHLLKLKSKFSHTDSILLFLRKERKKRENFWEV